MTHKKIKLKPTISIMIVLGIYVLLCSFYVNFIQDTIEQETYISLSEVTKQSSEVVKTQISGDFQTIQSIATFIGSHDTFDIEHSLPILQKVSQHNSFKRMGIILPEGNAITTDGKEYNLAEREYFQRSLKGETCVSNTFADIADGQNINVYSTPIYNNEEMVAVLFATMDTQFYKQLLSISSFGGQGYSYIMQSDGTSVIKSIHPNSVKDFDNMFDILETATFKKDSDFQELREQMRSGKSGHVEYKYNGTQRHMNYEPLGINNWCIASVVPEIITNQRASYIMNLIFVSTVATLILFLSLLIYISVIQNESKKKLKKMAFTDQVTGYSNWCKFEIDCQQLLDTNRSTNYVMINFDVDKFKVINDVFGFLEGNKLLQHIANTLQMHIKPEESFSRVSADSFNVLMKYGSDEKLIERIETIIATVNEFNPSYPILLSFGIYRITDKKLEINVLSDRANIAKYTVKNKRTHCYAFYDAQIRTAILHEKQIENDMLLGLKNNEFKMYLQPKYLFNTEKIIGAEALVRWIHPTQGMIPPDQFIPIFEKNGFVTKLDMFMFEQVCKQVHKWVVQYGNDQQHSISVNLSRVHLNNASLVSDLHAIALKYEVDPRYIEIEVTESTILENIDTLVSVIEQLKQVGFKISMDDFGSGYSSLNLLKDLNVNILKIDREFLSESTVTTRGKIIITNMIAMAKQLNIITVAEGVETKEQVAFLKDVQCDIAQGYYYAKPMPIEDFEKLLVEESK